VRALLVALSCSIVLALAPDARAQGERPVIEVTPGKARAFRVAVQRFIDRLEPADPTRVVDLRATIEEALEFSGSLLPLQRAAYLGPEETLQLSKAPRTDCIDWTQSGADGLLEGRLSGDGTRIAIDFQVWDTARCSLLVSDRVERPVGEGRRLGKEVADQATAAFTGTRGIANTEIAFVSSRTGRRELWVMEANGDGARAATDNVAIKSFPGWYPDGTAIVYTAHYPGKQPSLALSSRGALRPGLFLTRILPGAPKYRGVFHPSGNMLAFVSSVRAAAEIFTVHRDGSALRRVTHNDAIEISPTWSPDGNTMAFVSDRAGAPQIYLMDRDGRNPRRLTFQGSYNTAPAWSPDGRWIAYETRLEAQFDIWLIDPAGEVNFPLVDHPRSDETPTWSPNSRRLMFSSNRRGRYDLYTVDVTGDNLRRVTQSGGENLQPAWGPYSR